MPVCIEKRGKKWRIVNCISRLIEKTKKGNPIDGGGHATEKAAKRQAAAINSNLS